MTSPLHRWATIKRDHRQETKRHLDRKWDNENIMETLMKSKVLCILVIIFTALTVQGFCFNSENLTTAMNSACESSQTLDKLVKQSGSDPWENPAYREAEKMLGEAWKKIEKEIGSIETRKEIKTALTTIESFGKISEYRKALAGQVEFALTRQIRFLEAHGTLK